jgi:branched-chain amino acid transport system substrate-binding protein
VFRILGRSDVQAEVAGIFLASQFGNKKIAIVYNNAALGKGTAEAIKMAMNSRGTREELLEGYPPGTRDFTALISKMKASRIDVFYVAGPIIEAGLLIAQARQIGFDAQMVTGSVLASADFWKLTGEAGKGTLMVSTPDPSLSPQAKEVVEKFKKMGYDPRGYTLYAYAAMQTWAQAVQKIGSDDPTEVANNLHKAGELNTVIGNVSFDERGEIRNPRYALYKWDDGTYVEDRVLR